MVLAAIAYFQPVTRRELGNLIGREVSRDTLADLRSFGLIANGPKSPRAGSPNTYVTTTEFLSRFSLNSPQDREAIESAGALSPHNVEPSGLVDIFGITNEQAEETVTLQEAEI